MKARTLWWAALLVLLPAPALAWGPATHLFAGYYAAFNLNLLAPAAAALLSEWFAAFLYGTISADIYVGKGSRGGPRHCHNWGIGATILARAENDEQRAFAWGYLSHLAADVTAHNFYVPTQLFSAPLPGKAAHVFWETHCELALDQRLWRVARHLVRYHPPACNRLLRCVWEKGRLNHAAGNRLFGTSILIGNLTAWQRFATGLARHLPWQPDPKYLPLLQNVTLGVALEYLRDPDGSRAVRYDPVGSTPLLAARRQRRAGTRDNPFRIAPDLYDLRISRPQRAAFDVWLDGRLTRALRGHI
ncbi:MAG TPA: zinc dependent phospholipase C family protein [bacterium]|nr:zinc dependent phospholipase C family protein [bacterium]